VYVHFLLKTALAEIQNSFDGIFDNLFDAKSSSFADRLLSHVFKGFLGGWSRINSMGSQAADGLASNLVHQGLYDAKKRDELTEGIYLTSDRNQQIGRLDYAYNVVLKAQAAEGKMRKAVKAKLIPKAKGAELVASALKANVITEAEAALMKEAVDVRWDAIQVDSFSQAEYHKHGK
jgi:acyl-CoA dehydrogenase